MKTNKSDSFSSQPLTDEKCTVEPFQLQGSTKAHIRSPAAMVCLGDTLIIADLDLNHVIKVDKVGNVVAKYDLSEELGEVTGLTTYGKDFFVVQEKGITLVSSEDKNVKNRQIKVYKPNVRQIGKVLALNNVNFIISDGSNLLQYSATDNKLVPLNIKTQGLGPVSHIDTEVIKEERRYFVTFISSHTVHIYSQFWTRIAGIGGTIGSCDGRFYWPRSTAVISQTHFVVADYGNHRVSVFNMDGSFSGHLLSGDKQGLKAPVYLSYKAPLLWIMSYCYGKVSVSCWSLQI